MITFRSSWESHANHSGKCMKIGLRNYAKRGLVYPDSTRRCRNRTSYRKENYDYRVKSGRFSDCSGSGILGKNDERDLETLYRRYITSHYCKLSKMHFQYDKE